MDAGKTSKYYVLLEGRRIGPYDRRTIVGMRIKHMLTSEAVLADENGFEFTVADLIGRRGASASASASASTFNPSQSGSFSPAQATYSASLAGVAGRGLHIPDFRGEMEVRLHSDVLRLAGRYRRLFSRKDTRIKIPLALIARAQAQGSRVDLWLRGGEGAGVTRDTPMQRVSLDLFAIESARELLAALPSVPPPDPVHAQAVNLPASNVIWTWGGLIAVGASIGVVVLMLLVRRTF